MDDEPLRSGLEAINSASASDQSAELIAAKCRALLVGYAKRWAESEYVPTAVEVTLTSPLYNPATDYKSQSRILSVAGKLDVVATLNGKSILIDHKTTSDDATDPAGSYWRQLMVDSQASHYMLLEWVNGTKLDEAVWDVIRRPTISPKQLKSKAEHALAVSNRTYYGKRLSQETLDWLQLNASENTEMYEARLVQDCTETRPEWYFQRRAVPRLDSELTEYAQDLWDAGQLIIEARRLNRWLKHPGSCMNYGRPCQFLGICSGFDRPDSDKWTRKACVHSELPGLDGDGRDVLTFSRIRTFQSCPRKAYYRYEMGLERIDDDEGEALKFGSLMHVGLEAYWLSLLPKELSHGDTHVAELDTASEAPFPF